MKQMILKELNTLFTAHKETSLSGRYITNNMIALLIKKMEHNYQVKTVGYSEAQRPIYSITLGSGKVKILLWSQMHGNESTTTKAIFDLLNIFCSTSKLDDILKHCTLVFIPILNPDGAHLYTRYNANHIDLNRDAQDLSQSESRVLRGCFDNIKPHFCFNLHGQRTIFGAGIDGNPATLSFLAPAEDEERTVTETRKKAMAVIAQIYADLKKELPGAIGRYDDSFNINCVGDMFQSLKVPTILFEAGHYPNDYDREITRAFIFKALVSALKAISKGASASNFEAYFDIPENHKNYYDLIIRNAKLNTKDDIVKDVAIQFKEDLNNGNIVFTPIIEDIGVFKNHTGHKEIDAKGALVYDHKNELLKVSSAIDFVMLNNRKFLIKS